MRFVTVVRIGLGFLTLALCFLVGAAPTPIEPRKLQPTPKIKALPTPDDAIRLAKEDADAFANVPDFPESLNRVLALQFSQYVWLQTDDTTEMSDRAKVVSLVWDYAGRHAIHVKPTVVAGGRLVRFDYRTYFPSAADLQEGLVIREQLGFDPALSQLLTKKTIQIRPLQVVPTVKVKRMRHEKRGDEDIEIPEIVEVPFTEQSEINVVRLNDPSIDPQEYGLLQQQMATAAPVVSYEYFLFRMMDSIQGKVNGANTLYTDIFGGVYYQSRGIKRAKDLLGSNTKATDLDLYLDTFCGIGNAKLGIKRAEVFSRLRSDKRALVSHRRLTGQPSLIEFLPSLAVLGGWVVLTNDVKDTSVDVDSDPSLNLIKFRQDASELIADNLRRVHDFALFDGQENLLEEADIHIAGDRTVPEGHQPILRSPISCIRCHGPQDGWQPVVNDAPKFFKSILPTFDLTQRDQFVTQDRIDGLYAYDPQLDLMLARNRYAAGILNATVDNPPNPKSAYCPWPEGGNNVGQVRAAQIATGKLSEGWNHYWYDGVDARAALRYLGADVPQDKAVAFFKVAIAPEQSAEDARIRMLADGLTLDRQQFALIQSDLMARTRRTIPDMIKSVK